MSLGLPILGAEVAPTRAQADSQTFPETGQTVSGKFLDYWKAHGGLAQQGYPLTGAVAKTDSGHIQPQDVVVGRSPNLQHLGVTKIFATEPKIATALRLA